MMRYYSTFPILQSQYGLEELFPLPLRIIVGCVFNCSVTLYFLLKIIFAKIIPMDATFDGGFRDIFIYTC